MVCNSFLFVGYYCKYGKIVLFPGESYEKTTGPNCFKCTCSEDADELNCCEWVHVPTLKQTTFMRGSRGGGQGSPDTPPRKIHISFNNIIKLPQICLGSSSPPGKSKPGKIF